MAEWTSFAVQTVNPGEAILFTDNAVRCLKGLILHREDSGTFLIKGTQNCVAPRRCACMGYPSVNYMVDFGANIAIPAGGTVEPISVAFSLDGTTLPETIMTVTPAAVEEFFNVSRAANVEVWKNCCQTFSIRNIGVQAILMQNANLIFDRPDLAMTR